MKQYKAEQIIAIRNYSTYIYNKIVSMWTDKIIAIRNEIVALRKYVSKAEN